MYYVFAGGDGATDYAEPYASLSYLIGPALLHRGRQICAVAGRHGPRGHALSLRLGRRDDPVPALVVPARGRASGLGRVRRLLDLVARRPLPPPARRPAEHRDRPALCRQRPAVRAPGRTRAWCSASRSASSSARLIAGRLTEASWPSPCGSWSMVWTSVPRLTTVVCGSPATERAPSAARSTPDALQHAGLDRAARLRAAEQGLQRLAARIVGGGVGLARARRGQREIGRHDQRRVARDGELVGAAAAEQAAARAAGEQEGGRSGQERGGRYAWSTFLLLRRPIAHQERADKQKQHADGNRRVADIEDQKGPPLAEMQVGEVDDIAEPAAIERCCRARRRGRARAPPNRRGASPARATRRRSRRSARCRRPAASGRDRSPR